MFTISSERCDVHFLRLVCSLLWTTTLAVPNRHCDCLFVKRSNYHSKLIRCFLVALRSLSQHWLLRYLAVVTTTDATVFSDVDVGAPHISQDFCGLCCV